jgi:hypothetical protein
LPPRTGCAVIGAMSVAFSSGFALTSRLPSSRSSALLLEDAVVLSSVVNAS